LGEGGERSGGVVIGAQNGASRRSTNKTGRRDELYGADENN
jgi:hypothetical protein